MYHHVGFFIKKKDRRIFFFRHVNTTFKNKSSIYNQVISVLLFHAPIPNINVLKIPVSLFFPFYTIPVKTPKITKHTTTITNRTYKGVFL